MHHRRLISTLVLLGVSFAPAAARAGAPPSPLAELQHRLLAASSHAPGRIGIAFEELATGYVAGVNAGANMPAASTIKSPVMVEVFRQMSLGNVLLTDVLHVQRSDRDYGSGRLCYARAGTAVTVTRLLLAMITDSDNTATNMLIRLVGRGTINATMRELGLNNTKLGDYIRSNGSHIRSALRTSPRDMLRLLEAMAHDRLIDEWSSREMLAILGGQQHNTLLPQPLPAGLAIAHKTGSLHDTLNDVGIVYLDGEPYAIAVMTTNLSSLSAGRKFIRAISRLAYDSFERTFAWREAAGLPAFILAVPSEPFSTEPAGAGALPFVAPSLPTAAPAPFVAPAAAAAIVPGPNASVGPPIEF